MYIQHAIICLSACLSVYNTLCSLLKSSPWAVTHCFCCAPPVRSFDWVQKLKRGPSFRQGSAINNRQRHSYRERAECLSRWWETLLCWPLKLVQPSLIAILHSHMKDGVRGGKQQDKAVSQQDNRAGNFRAAVLQEGPAYIYKVTEFKCALHLLKLQRHAAISLCTLICTCSHCSVCFTHLTWLVLMVHMPSCPKVRGSWLLTNGYGFD